MKVETKRKEKEFEPIELTITIESRAELIALNELSLRSLSIQDVIPPNYKDKTKTFLDYLRQKTSYYI